MNVLVRKELDIVLTKLNYKGVRRRLFIKKFERDPEGVSDELYVTIKNNNKLTNYMTKRRWHNNYEYLKEKVDGRWGDLHVEIDEWNEKYPPGHPEHIV